MVPTTGSPSISPTSASPTTPSPTTVPNTESPTAMETTMETTMDSTNSPTASPSAETTSTSDVLVEETEDLSTTGTFQGNSADSRLRCNFGYFALFCFCCHLFLMM